MRWFFYFGCAPFLASGTRIRCSYFQKNHTFLAILIPGWTRFQAQKLVEENTPHHPLTFVSVEQATLFHGFVAFSAASWFGVAQMATKNGEVNFLESPRHVSLN